MRTERVFWKDVKAGQGIVGYNDGYRFRSINAIVEFISPDKTILNMMDGVPLSYPTVTDRPAFEIEVSDD